MSAKATWAASLSMLLVLVILRLALATPAQAQTDFTDLKVHVGEVVWVTQPSGATISGPISALAPSTITIHYRTVFYEPGLKIARKGDSLPNGFLIGAGIGAVAGSTVAAEACLDTPLWHCTVGGAIGYGAVGAFVDWLHKGRTVIFKAPSAGKRRAYLVPELDRTRRGVGVVLTF